MKEVLKENKKIVDLLWLAVALFAPLFSVSFLRINVVLFNLIFHFTVSDIFMTLIFFTGVLDLCFNKRAGPKTVLYKKYGDLLVFTGLFFLWHVFSISRSHEMALAVKNTIRLLSGMLAFWCVLIFFPRDSGFLRKFFNVFIWSMSFMLVYLLYVYAFVFKCVYLSSDLGQEARWGKNQLSYFIARILPFAFFTFYFSKKKLIDLVPVFIFAVSIVYASSRGGWVALFYGFISILGVVLYKERVAGLRSILKIVALLILVFGVSVLTLSRIVNMEEIQNRFNSIFNPNSSESLYFTRTPVLPVQTTASSCMTEETSPKYPANLLPPPVSHVNSVAPPALPEKNAGSCFNGIEPSHLSRVYVSSYVVRGHRVGQALRGFLTSPVIGVGLANADTYADGLIHNDYAAILLEMGSIGIVLFLGILWAVTRRLFSGRLLREKRASWAYLGAIGSWTALPLVSMVYDSYVAAYFWMFLALFVVIAEIEGTVKNIK